MKHTSQFARAENWKSGHPASFSELISCKLLNVVPVLKVKDGTFACVQQDSYHN